MDLQKEANAKAVSTSIEAALPTFGLAIAREKPILQLCKPKLLPLKTYSYMKMQIQTRNRIDQELPHSTRNAN